jgi:hypothetical protein
MLAFFLFSGLRMENRLQCSLASVFTKNDIDELHKETHYGENAMTTLSRRRQAVQLVAHHYPYAPLYQAVILRAVQDLAQKQHWNEAREWLLSSDSDYSFAKAGISPQSIRQQMI